MEDSSSNASSPERRILLLPQITRGFRPEANSKMIEPPPPSSGSLSSKRSVSFGSRAKREIAALISMNTQTDWEWVTDAIEAGEGRLPTPLPGEEEPTLDQTDLKSILVKPDAPEVESVTEARKSVADVVTEDVSMTMPMTPYSDEFGIPFMDISTDSDDSSGDESNRREFDDHNLLPSIGPPQILQYKRESEQVEANVETPDSLMTDEHGRAVGMFGGICEFCGETIKPFPSMERQQHCPAGDLFCCEEYREFVNFATTTAMELEEEARHAQKLIDIRPHAHFGTKQDRKIAKERAVMRMRERELQRRQREATGLQQNFYGGARQMKTINYQLSSQRCLDEGWTLRPPSPLDDDESEMEIFVPEPITSPGVRNLIQKFYRSGQKFLTIFPDGSGNVFYPSGNLAIMISYVSLGQHIYVVHDDSPDSKIMAQFQPNGKGTCYHERGSIRLFFDQLGGIELDVYGGRRRKWSWKDPVTHTHPAPFQPIHVGLNGFLGIRVMSQDNIALTFVARSRSCRFNIGSRLKLVAPENIHPKEIAEADLFLDECKVQVRTILDRVATLLKFPNSPKVNSILPPIHLTNKIHKIAELRQKKESSKLAKTKRTLPDVCVT